MVKAIALFLGLTVSSFAAAQSAAISSEVQFYSLDDGWIVNKLSVCGFASQEHLNIAGLDSLGEGNPVQLNLTTDKLGCVHAQFKLYSMQLGKEVSIQIRSTKGTLTLGIRPVFYR